MKNMAFMVLALIVVTTSPVLALVTQGPPEAGEVALIIALPWGPPIDDVLTTTALQEIHPDRAPFSACVMMPDIPSDARPVHSGPWLVLKGAAILELC